MAIYLKLFENNSGSNVLTWSNPACNVIVGENSEVTAAKSTVPDTNKSTANRSKPSIASTSSTSSSTSSSTGNQAANASGGGAGITTATGSTAPGGNRFFSFFREVQRMSPQRQRIKRSLDMHVGGDSDDGGGNSNSQNANNERRSLILNNKRENTKNNKNDDGNPIIADDDESNTNTPIIRIYNEQSVHNINANDKRQQQRQQQIKFNRYLMADRNDVEPLNSLLDETTVTVSPDYITIDVNDDISLHKRQSQFDLNFNVVTSEKSIGGSIATRTDYGRDVRSAAVAVDVDKTKNIGNKKIYHKSNRSIEAGSTPTKTKQMHQPSNVNDENDRFSDYKNKYHMDGKTDDSANKKGSNSTSINQKFIMANQTVFDAMNVNDSERNDNLLFAIEHIDDDSSDVIAKQNGYDDKPSINGHVVVTHGYNNQDLPAIINDSNENFDLMTDLFDENSAFEIITNKYIQDDDKHSENMLLQNDSPVIVVQYEQQPAMDVINLETENDNSLEQIALIKATTTMDHENSSTKHRHHNNVVILDAIADDNESSSKINKINNTTNETIKQTESKVLESTHKPQEGENHINNNNKYEGYVEAPMLKQHEPSYEMLDVTHNSSNKMHNLRAGLQRILVNVSIATDNGDGTPNHGVYTLHVSVPAGSEFIPLNSPQQQQFIQSMPTVALTPPYQDHQDDGSDGEDSNVGVGFKMLDIMPSLNLSSSMPSYNCSNEIFHLNSIIANLNKTINNLSNEQKGMDDTESKTTAFEEYQTQANIIHQIDDDDDSSNSICRQDIPPILILEGKTPSIAYIHRCSHKRLASIVLTKKSEK